MQCQTHTQQKLGRTASTAINNGTLLTCWYRLTPRGWPFDRNRGDINDTIHHQCCDNI